MINILDKNTIDQIAAGEVVERPASAVKELVENALDAGATAVTVELKDGGIGLIRVTDNGCGIDKDEIRVAFYRHATSKIKTAEDLINVSSLGFRGEALSSIASVAKVEVLTKKDDAFIGTRYVIEGGEEKTLEDAGCTDGTTFLVRDLFYNTPVRRKFLKSNVTETGYVAELLEKLALSEPFVSFKLISNGKVILHTTGNGKIQDIFLELYGAETARALLEINAEDEERGIKLTGVIAKPHVTRGTRGLESFFVNTRYVRCNTLKAAVEDGYKGFLMGHNYPVCALYLSLPYECVDVNVHPSKLELKFTDSKAIYELAYNAVRDTLSGKNMIVKASLSEEPDQKEIKKENEKRLNETHIPEPFEIKKPATPLVQEIKKPVTPLVHETKEALTPPALPWEEPENNVKEEAVDPVREQPIIITDVVQTELPPDIYRDHKKEFRIVGQVLKTYWIIEMDNTVYMIDQHAAHEKVLYEKAMRYLKTKTEMPTQAIMPAEILSLSIREAAVLNENIDVFLNMGFEISEFGGSDFKLTGIPADLVDVDLHDLFSEILSSMLSERDHNNPDVLTERIATMSCKAAVKGNNELSFAEAKALIESMFELEDPYHCPHGRPTTISFSKSELEKKFKRIV
ncbi:MAG: DNA mismatch repair endonuclease MutL [Lachnospiraceae bacterium]|nr:DNA mismatch repair endonuclease MutL [Lachnospiraceae bacterium]